MLADLPPYLQKLWDKGIDISAGILIATLSAGIATGIALLGWKVKLHFDLKAEEERRHLRRVERRARLEQEREGLANAAVAAANIEVLRSVLLHYETWLQKYELLPVNAQSLNSLKNALRFITHTTSVEQLRTDMSTAIRNTQLLDI